MHRRSEVVLIGLATALLLTGSTTWSADPTPQQIASSWASFSGGLAGRVLYSANDKLWVLDLQSGSAVAVTDFPVGYVGTSSRWGGTIGLKMSPDGTRFAAQNNSAVVVCNIDGSNKQIIWQGSIDRDMLAIGWDEKENSKLYYTQKTRIVCTTINSNNTPGATTTLVTSALTGFDGYTAVQKCGDYISFGLQGGVNQPWMYRISTKEAKRLIQTDGCQPRMLMDGLGRLVCHENTHFAPATILNWNGQRVGTVPIAGSCGINGVNSSYDGKFAINCGDNDITRNPTCIKTTYIRKVSDWSSMYLGSTMYWPDIWAGATGTQAMAPQIGPDDISFIDSLRIALTTTTAGAEIRYTINGQTPTATSTLYNGPFTIKATTIVKAVAIKNGTLSNVAEKTYVKATLRAPDNPDNTEHGLWYKYYQGTWTRLPDFSALTPFDTGAIDSFSLAPRKVTSNYGFVFSGYIDVPQDGLYAFYLSSNDGAVLLIGDTVVVNHDVMNSTTEASGTIGLRTGKHRIMVRHYDNGGSSALSVKYEMGTLITKSVIPALVLYRVKNTAAPWLEVLAPVKGQLAPYGDTLTVKWIYHGGGNQMVTINLSRNGGKTYPVSLNDNSAFVMSGESALLKYVVPKNDSMVTASAMVAVADYNAPGVRDYSGLFSIVKPASTDRRTVSLQRGTEPGTSVLLYTVQGRQLSSPEPLLRTRHLSGVYIVKVKVGGTTVSVRRAAATR